MTRENQIIVDDDEDAVQFTCTPCDRDFVSEGALFQHCRTASTHRGEWCERCEWLFVSAAARQDHIAKSSHHWTCNLCTGHSPDYETEEDLDEHLTAAHNYCFECDTATANKRQHDVAVHMTCRKCAKTFTHPNSLTEHMRAHLPRCMPCYGCTRQFASYANIVSHLETGVCASGCKRDHINHAAYCCPQSSAYLNWNPSRNDYPYECCSCDAVFERVSGMLQHAETNTCDANVDDDPLASLLLSLENYVEPLGLY